ncbi:TIGR02302 family protein [Pararhizobium haloflavum]|uniref:TIGR02302 family protein n=1 Tax=Pararhizobium haloflavum TaxID=2037914 RepID=UPI000C1774C4|nr:TIGR02302 family protein [Pararhizobium haloflavum]
MAFTRLTETADALTAKLARKRLSVLAVIAAERFWLLVLPSFALLALFVTLAWVGYFRSVPDWLRLSTLAVFAGGLIYAVALLRHFRMPDRTAADRRLEATNAIGHQAISTQNDRIESETPFSRALWEEHRRRMAERIQALKVGFPEPDTPRRDPFALRAAVVLLLVCAFGYSHSNQAGRVSDAFVSHAVSNAPATRIDAWITPPDYTKRAPIFLSAIEADDSRPIAIPQDSEIVVRVSGGVGQETVAFQAANAQAAAGLAVAESQSAAASPPDGAAAQETARSYAMRAQESGSLSVSGAGEGNRSWRFDVITDAPPTIAFASDPRRAVNGALEIAFNAQDDYGVQAARAIIEQVEPGTGARPLYDAPDYQLGLPRRGARTAEGRASQDFTDHPWSGTKIRITLVATDAAGQEGRSESHEMVMPERGFSEPLARAVVEQRQILARDANAVPDVLALNDALTIAPEETIDNLAHFLLLKSARSRIEQAFNDDMLRDAADYLWDIALGIEDGDLSLAERRLRDAQRELAEALENGATDAEIQALMDELREAMQDYLQALAEELQNSDQAMQLPEGAMDNLLREQDLNSMLDQIENLARQGARDEAQQMLSELQRMMDNLQAGRQQQQGNSPMRQQMDELGELMREQQQLMDETFRMDQALRERMQQGMPNQQPPGQQGQQGQQGEQGQQPGQQGQQGGGAGEMTTEELQQALRSLREQQEALQEQLGQLQQELEGLGIEPGEGFGQAGEAMGDAARSLGEGRGEQAVGEQGQALEALRQGAQDMMNQMMQAMGQGQGEGEGQGQGPRQMRRSETDPLGRPRSTQGPDFGDDVRVPDEIDIQRAREILDAIRDRLGNALSPELEKRYLERLLDLQ